MFSFGVVLWEIVCELPAAGSTTSVNPLVALEEDRYVQLIHAGVRPPMPAHTAPEYQELVRSCWATDPVARPTMQDVVRVLGALWRRAEA